MLGAFVKGIVGTAMTAVALILFFILIGSGVSAGTAFVIAVVTWTAGNYLVYVSRQTVRTRR